MLSKAQIKMLCKIEAEAYPKHMQYMQDIRSWADVQDYCESEKVEVLLREHFYCIAAEDEVVDLASISKLSLKDISEVIAFLKSKYQGNTFTLDAREDTSYPLLKVLEKRGRIQVFSDDAWDWDGVVMHEMQICFL